MASSRLALPVVVLLFAGCASTPPRPVFYPNAHYNAVSPAQVRRDTDDCVALAERSGVGATRDGEVGRKAATGAAVGGAGAGAWGLVRGNDAGERALAGAAAGAATGAVKGTLDGGRPNPTWQRFVQRCLTDRGYDVIGWE
jgi:hypothetical protein